MKKIIYILVGIVLLIVGVWGVKKVNINPNYRVGQPLDSLNRVIVYYNGGVGNVTGRNVSEDGYNLGMKYQCVEFVKRYYYQYLKHKMPDSYGNAKDFFDLTLQDGGYNKQRDLVQYANPSKTKPQVDDLLIFAGTLWNKYGHVAIVSNVTDNSIEIIQQNPGPFGKSRQVFSLENKEKAWIINNEQVLGWLRK